MNKTILVADDDKGILVALKMLLIAEGYDVVCVDSPQAALASLSRQEFALLITDLNFSLDTTSGDEGIQLIKSVRKIEESMPIVVMTGWGTIDVAVSTMQIGANDFIEKPWENERLLAIVANQIKFSQMTKLSQKLTQQNALLHESDQQGSAVIAESDRMKQLLVLIDKVAQTDASVLIKGENGCGKSMFSRYIHTHSNRKEQPHIAVNMGAVTESLFESEMFGHVKGAFTDAKSTRIGRFELADGGSLFLDEIANTPYSQQGKLLRVLEERQFEKVGSSKTQQVDIRLISATNANLQQLIETGKFRKDLYFRMNTIEIEIPPLRERKADIIPLARSFLQQVASKYRQPVPELSEDAQRALEAYAWPGNVRELNHVMERAQILSSDKLISESTLGINAVPHIKDTRSEAIDLTAHQESTLEEIELDVIKHRLVRFEDNASAAAESLGLSRSAFYRRLEKLNKTDPPNDEMK